MLSIEVLNMIITSLSLLVLLYPFILILIILILVYKIIGFKHIINRIRTDRFDAIKNSILFELTLGLFIMILIPVIIITCFPDKIIFNTYTFAKVNWTITPFMIIFFLIDIPLTLFISLDIHNTHGMIFVMYSFSIGYVISLATCCSNVFEITPPYFFY